MYDRCADTTELQVLKGTSNTDNCCIFFEDLFQPGAARPDRSARAALHCMSSSSARCAGRCDRALPANPPLPAPHALAANLVAMSVDNQAKAAIADSRVCIAPAVGSRVD